VTREPRPSAKQALSKAALEKLVLKEASGEWGCEDLTGVTIERCDPAIYRRNWTVSRLQNEDLPAARHTIAEIVERLGERYELAET